MLDPRTPYIVRKEGRQGIFTTAIDTQFIKGQLCFVAGYDPYRRGHMLDGKVVKELKNGIVFDYGNKRNGYERLTFTPMTYEEFNTYIRPYITERESAMIHDLDDAYFWYRRCCDMA